LRPTFEFPTIGGENQPPPPRAPRERAALALLHLANRLLPKRRGKVVLHSTVDVDDGILAVASELSRRGIRPTMLLEEPRREGLVRALSRSAPQTVKKHSVRGTIHYLRAQFVVTTHGLFGDPEPPASQVVVNLWHGEPPTKVVGRFEGQHGHSCTVAPVLSTVGRAYRAVEFGVHPHRVPVIGAPRNDRMVAADGQRIRQRLLGDLGIAANGGFTFLWMPTFRAARFSGRLRVDAETAHTGVPYDADALERLDRWLQERGATVLLKLHPHDVASFTGSYGALRVLDGARLEAAGVTTYELLAAFDCLITDASSVWTDYLLLDRPMLFAFPDVEDYRRRRGLNIEPFESWAPGEFVHSMDELIEAMGRLIAGDDSMADERRRARERFHAFHDGRSTARLLDGLGLRR
jgi:CDP-glycerol glycerophosphotransferase (TagB/SpsB family)